MSRLTVTDHNHNTRFCLSVVGTGRRFANIVGLVQRQAMLLHHYCASTKIALWLESEVYHESFPQTRTDWYKI